MSTFAAFALISASTLLPGASVDAPMALELPDARPVPAALEADVPVPGVMVEAGIFHAGEVPTHLPAEGWLALRATGEGDGLALSRATVETRKTVDPLLDEPGQATGVDVVITVDDDAPGETILALRGLPLSAGPVLGEWPTTALLEPGRVAALPSFGGTSRLLVTDANGIDDPELADPHAGLEVLLQTERDGAVTVQSLASLPGSGLDGGPYLLWAGDLDGDQQVDLLLELDGDTSRSNTVLLLSSVARDGDLVGVAAILDTFGC